MSTPGKTPSPGLRLAKKVKWRALVLVCGKCDKRADRDGVPAKEARKRLKKGLRDLKPAVRVAICGCLGICPKKALIVAGMTPEGEPTVAVVKSPVELEDFCAHLRARLSDG